MHVNTSVVKALMYLRGVGEPTLAGLVHVTLSDLQSWLYDLGEDSEERVSFETQIEILRLLGVSADSPRPDVVHYWRIHEPLFSRSATTYWALTVMLKAFGKAQCVFIAREADPSLNFKAQSHFGLRFDNFMAILEVTAHPLRSISFDPDTMPDLSWVPETLGVLLPENEFDRLEPGSMKVKGLTQYLTYTTEMAQWERLREAAQEHGIRAEQVASLLLGTNGPVRLAKDQAAAARPETQGAVASAELATKDTTSSAEHQKSDSTQASPRAETPASSRKGPGDGSVEAPPASTRAVGELKNAATDDMRLFITPVKAADKPSLKRVS